MTTAKQIEPNVNNALGNLLKTMMPTCKVLSENTQTFPDHPGRHADVLVIATGRSPVTVEAEFEPAPEAEKDARERLGLKVEGEPRTIILQRRPDKVIVKPSRNGQRGNSPQSKPYGLPDQLSAT